MPRSQTMTYLVTLFLVLGGALMASGQEGKKIFAQKLLDETLAKHKNVVIMAMHVTPPGQTDNVIIASNIGRIGKKADEDDMRVIEYGQAESGSEQERRPFRSGVSSSGPIRQNHRSRRHRLQLRKRQRSRVPEKRGANSR